MRKEIELKAMQAYEENRQKPRKFQIEDEAWAEWYNKGYEQRVLDEDSQETVCAAKIRENAETWARAQDSDRTCIVLLSQLHGDDLRHKSSICGIGHNVAATLTAAMLECPDFANAVKASVTAFCNLTNERL